MDEMNKVIEQINGAFSEYKKVNDERLNAIEKNANVGELTSKLNRVEADLKKLEEAKSAMEAKMNRPAGLASDPEADAYKSAFNGWVRKGVDGGLSQKAVNTGTDADGGYAVPEAINMNVYNLLRNSTPMRQACSVVTVGTNNYSQLVGLHGATGGWVGETDARGATNSPQLAKASAIMGEVYANPQATQQSLDDIYFNVESWLAQEIADEFAVMENSAFTKGDGTNKPKGLFSYATATTKDGSRAFGTLQHVVTGVAGDFGANPFDNLIDLMATLKSGYAPNAKWMMTRSTLAQLRKVKDAHGDYLWTPSMEAGISGSLLGYGVIVNDDMDEIGANKLAVAFGDFKSAYTIVDRAGIRMLRDPYSNKPYVGFYTTKRVGGMLKDSEAVKLLKFSA